MRSTVCGERVTLRAVVPADLDTLATWFCEPGFSAWWGGAPKSRDEVELECVADDPTRFPFVIEEDGAPVGYIQAWSDAPPDGGIDIVLVPPAQNRGLGPDAVRALALHLK